ncbi:hypothetical protein UFOVP178_38 [uncultured Caudovirales phage]|uniref:Uncharacterized protein n=1 Tax=uncultured Caudovirales phage TaxID=2100421 RepID=A0A6J7WBG2_9CAUD|nr:hypothetical protein UFOVP178_38 [uncultured Caudovirales phage]
MTEIEQLREEIKILNEAAEIASKLDGFGCETYGNIRARKMKEAELARLEAEAAEKADPWLNVKADVKYLNDVGGNSGIHIMARYARHLEQRVAELAQRPVVYVLRRKKTGKVETWRSHGGGEIPVIFLPCEVKWRQETVRQELDDYAFEPYTGEQK